MATFQVTDEDYSLIAADLFRAERYLSRLKEAESANEDRMVREALTMAAIVSYCRPFMKSKDAESKERRWVPKELVKDLPAECQATHRKLEDYRNQARAHTDWRAHQPKFISSGNTDILPSLIFSRDPWVPLSHEEISAFERLLQEVNGRIVPSSVAS